MWWWVEGGSLGQGPLPRLAGAGFRLPSLGRGDLGSPESGVGRGAGGRWPRLVPLCARPASQSKSPSLHPRRDWAGIRGLGGEASRVSRVDLGVTAWLTP